MENVNQDILSRIEEVRQKNPRMAQVLERAYQAFKKKQEPSVQSADPASTDTSTPAVPPPPPSQPPAPAQDEKAASASAQIKWAEVRNFEWQDLLAKAEELIRQAGDWGRLGPLAPLVRLMVAFAVREGARHIPEREAIAFLAQWEVAEMLGISTRTLERWLNDASYQDYRNVAQDWIAWETWMTSGEEIGQKGAVRGGTVWRIRVKPVRRKLGRKIRVLAPYLRLPWRSLAQDRQEGRTQAAKDSMSGYKDLLKDGRGLTLQVILGGSLVAIQTKKSPLLLYPDTHTVRDFRALMRAASIPGGRKGRRAWAQQVASAIAGAIGDQKSLNFWLKAVWAALRAITYGGGEGALRVLFRVTCIAKEARQDGFARSPGAYAQHLLRREGFWDLTNPFAAYRVG
jgi:hypothetical protein